MTPTLGFEPETTLSKLQVAHIQLNDAIDLFVQQHFLSSLTLAGAAEEIFGKILGTHGQRSAIDESLFFIDQIRTEKGIKIGGNQTNSQLKKGWNKVRNNVKHHNVDDGQEITVNLCDEAYWMIRRALENAVKLGQKIDASQDFERWIIQNIN